MLTIGLTGGIGSGKSAAARMFAELGAAVVDTDAIAHRLTAPGAPALGEIAERLGAEYLQPDGSLDRARLRQRIFADPAAKAQLEAILHPLIRQEAAAQVADSRAPYSLVVVPLLVETGGYRELIQRVLVVDCREETQVARTMARSKLTEQQVHDILANQVTRRQRLNHADDVIDNDGSLAALERQVLELHEKYLELADAQPFLEKETSMPQLQLVSHAICPYAQRVAITLLEKNAPFERTDIDLTNPPEWFPKLSPLGKVPLLQVDGEVIFESAVICEYLDETIPPRLHPADSLARARHRAWIEFASALLGTLWEFNTAQDGETLEAKCKELQAKFTMLEKNLETGPFFAGSEFSLVDAAFAPAFRYFDVYERSTDFGVFAGLEKIQAWRSALAARPSVRQAVSADYPDKLLAFLKARNSEAARRLAAAS